MAANMQRRVNVLIAAPEGLQNGDVGERGFYIRTAGLGQGDLAQDALHNRIYFTRMVVLHRSYLTHIGFRIENMNGADQVNVRVACYRSTLADRVERPYYRLTQASYMYTATGPYWAAVPRVRLEPGLYFLAFQCDDTNPGFTATAFLMESGVQMANTLAFASFPLHIDPHNGVELVAAIAVCLLGWLEIKAYRTP